MEMVAKIANMKIANPGRTRTMIEGGQGYEIDGKLCSSVPDNAFRIKDRVAFMDRFYTVAETALRTPPEPEPEPELPPPSQTKRNTRR